MNGVVHSNRVRGYVATKHWYDVLVNVAGAAVNGFWLGLLDEADLRELADRYYRDEGPIPERRYLQDDYNTRGLWPWEQAAIERYFPPSGRVVVTAAGAGREVLALRRLGYDAVGYECNRTLVEFGQKLLERHDAGGRLQYTPADAWPAQAGRCDAIVVGWGSYGLTVRRSDRVEFLRSARRVLPDGGPILLSFWARSAISRPLRLQAAVANVLRRIRGAPAVDAGDALHGHFVHVFTRDQIEAEIREGGFGMVHYDLDDYAHAVGVANETGSL